MMRHENVDMDVMVNHTPDRQIWLTMFFPFPPYSQLWIIHMVGYHCSRLQKSTLGQK